MRRQGLFSLLICMQLYATKELTYLWPKGPQGELTTAFFNYIIPLFNITTFVETGTYLGDTIANAIPFCNKIYSVELSQQLYENACHRFADVPNVFLYQGSSDQMLDRIIPHLEGTVLFWLDAHWSGGQTVHGKKATPIIEELTIIKKYNIKNAIIMIDDIRYFKGDRPADYPDIVTIYNLVKSINPAYKFFVYGDIAVAFDTSEKIEVSDLIQGMTWYYLPIFSASSDAIIKLFRKATPQEQLAVEQLASNLPVPRYKKWLRLLT